MGDLSLTSFDKVFNFPDPQLTFKWYCQYLPFTAETGMNTDYLESVDIPFNNIGAAEGVHVGSTFTNFPDTHNVDSFPMTFYEDRFGTTLNWILYWKSQVKDFKTGVYKLPRSYKRNLITVQLDQKNEPIVAHKMTGVWPGATAPRTLNFTDGSGRVLLQQQFNLDNIEHTNFRLGGR